MSKVLFLVNHDVVIYNFRLELVEELLKQGHDVFISCPNGERINELTKLGAVHRDIYISRHGINPFRDMKLIREYKKLIKDIRPDIIFTYTIKPNIYGAIAAKKHNIPCVANITGLGMAVENQGIKQKICILLYKHAFKKIKKVFLQNEENREFFIKHKIAIGKHDLLPGSGVNLDRFRPLPFPKTDVINFVFIGRILEEKGIEYYLQCAKYIKEKYANVEFHVCGFVEDKYHGKLQQFVDDGIVIYHGMVRDIRAIHAFSHCTVFPSFYPEGMSNVLLEASACARPVITTNRSGCRETVDDCITGYVVPVKNQDALNNAVERFFNSEQKERMGINARAKVEKEFDRQIIVKKYLEELKQCKK